MTFPKFVLPPGGFAVLTLTEPWASLVVLGEKEWETRGWPTSYRGLLLIQAAKSMPRYAQEACLSEPFESVLHRHGRQFDVHPDSVGGAKAQRAFGFNFGAIIGAVELTDTARTEVLAEQFKRAGTPRAMRELTFGNYDYSRWAFRFAKPRQFAKTIPVRGALGIWALTGESADAVREQLGATAVTP